MKTAARTSAVRLNGTAKWQQTLTGANLTLSFANPGTMTSAGDRLTVFDVSTPASQVRQGGAGKTGIYGDLSGGTQFGGAIPPAGPFSVALNANAGTVFTAVAQTGGLLTLGLSTVMTTTGRIDPGQPTVRAITLGRIHPIQQVPRPIMSVPVSPLC